jgi:integrase
MLDMIKIRTKDKCKKCHGKLYDTGKAFECPVCLVHARKYYIEWYYQGERFRVWALNSYVEALKKGRDIECEIEAGKFKVERYKGPGSKVNVKYQFEHVYDEWLKDRKKDLDHDIISPSYYKALKQYKKDFVAYFDKSDIRTIRTYDIKKWFFSLPDTLSPKTIKNKKSVLQLFFRELCEDDLIDDMPKFKRIKVAQKEQKWIDEDTQLKILAHIPPDDKPIFEFMMKTGARPGEARALKWDAVKDDYILIKATFSVGQHRDITKNKKVREIPLYNWMKELLNGLLRTPATPYIFWYVIGKKKCVPYGEKKLRGIWHDACGKANVEDITLYEGTRHSFASQSVNKGISLTHIGAIMGHSTPQTTTKYAHLDRVKMLKGIFE